MAIDKAKLGTACATAFRHFVEKDQMRLKVLNTMLGTDDFLLIQKYGQAILMEYNKL
jgi:hypothetical protein